MSRKLDSLCSILISHQGVPAEGALAAASGVTSVAATRARGPAVKILQRFRGLSAKIYAAFLAAAAVPVAVAGLVGIYYSVDALRAETLQHLEQEVESRATAMGRFFDQLTSELLYLATSPLLADVANSLARGSGRVPADALKRLERDYTAFARAYPYLYQVRFLDSAGREVVRVDRREGRLYTVAQAELQDKSGRYYVQETLSLEPGQVYVSPLDLNIEHGRIEVPERPVVRFATPVADRKGRKQGFVVINLHAEFMLEQIQEMAGVRGGVAYLFDRSGFYVSRSADPRPRGPLLQMQSVEALAATFTRALLTKILTGMRGTEGTGDWIVAYAPVVVGTTLAERSDDLMNWAIASSFPRNRLFQAVFNLSLLYGVLALCLLATAVAGYALSRHFLRPLTVLGRETGEIARGNFSRRVEVRGHDEIADLAERFNAMVAQLDHFHRIGWFPALRASGT
jgi:HAMP domain-containing protein